MQVKLLYSTPEPQKAIAAAARICYSESGASELCDEMTEKSIESVLSTIMKCGHYSALEHASYTFSVDRVSRSLTHQLVRHRMASYNQQSQRYVTLGINAKYVEPPSVKKNEEARELFQATMFDNLYAYSKLVSLGIPKEDARYILPNATESKIVVTMNARELLHFFNLRCCKRAQWEIRELALKMLDLVKPTAPLVFENAGAPCLKSTCPEGNMTCGNPYKQKG